MPTYREMCATIAEARLLRKADGSAPTFEELFEVSPRGVLWRVFGWYSDALVALGQEPYRPVDKLPAEPVADEYVYMQTREGFTPYRWTGDEWVAEIDDR
jgi:hypothetical protein